LLCISGYDLNNCSSAGLSGWEVLLTKPDGSTVSAETNETGYYEFCGLSPGYYSLSETMQPGWQSVSSPAPVTLTCNDSEDNNFKNQPLLCISGYDLNNCSSKGLSGREVILTKPDGSTASAETNETGYYEFCGLAPGYYSLSETMQLGWQSVSSPAPVTLTCNDSEDNNFVNQPLLCISGYDLNNCSSKGLSGWEVILTKPDGSTASTETNETGYYEFCGLAPGYYSLSETVQSGWQSVSTPAPVTLTCNDSEDNNFKNQPLFCIEGRKINGENETGLANWPINLTDSAGNVLETTTNDTGYYSFCDLQPGEYSVCEVELPNWEPDGDVCRPLELTCSDERGIDFINYYIESNETPEPGPVPDLHVIKKTNDLYADSAPGPYIPIGGAVNWTYEVVNTGNTSLVNVTVIDDKLGLVGEIPILEIGESHIFIKEGNAEEGQYTNNCTASALSPEGTEVNDTDISHYYGESASINVEKYTNDEDADIAPGPIILVGDPVTWKYVVTTNSNVPLHNVAVTDSVPGVMPIYIGGDSDNDGNLSSTETWIYQATGIAVSGQYTNIGKATAKTPDDRTAEDEDPSHYFGDPGTLTITKTVDKPTAHRGEDITYTVILSNNCSDICFTNVTLWDILPSSVELVTVSPSPSSSSSSNLTWNLGTFCPGDFVATIVVRIPDEEMNYDMTQDVSGEGFVNVHNNYNTHQGPESITNCAYAKADLIETISSCSTTGIVDPGTELQRREFGSGTYASEEKTEVKTENKSIITDTSLSAVHRPTTFSLSQGRSIDYTSKWTEKSKGINTISGATMNEEYTSANRIDKNRSIELDENGSSLKTEVEFEGSGHIGVLKKQSSEATPTSTPVYEAKEDYVGKFKISEAIDEYGSSVQSNKSVTGYGYVAVDKRVKGSQRTSESGTGSYQSEEIIDTPSNYIAKEISLVHGPTNYSYTPTVNVSQDMKWTEAISSKSGILAGGDILASSKSCSVASDPSQSGDCNGTSPQASYISERYSSLDYLKKESVVAGLGEMNTNASFSGMADYRVLSAGTGSSDKIDSEDTYIGQYNVIRKVQLTGVSHYDRPHVTVTMQGNMTSRWFNNTNAGVAKYAITITNDGDRSLAPINVRDIFPPGTEYISSSIRPSSVSNSAANWTLLHLGIGSTIEIELELNVTDYAPSSLVNRVMVCAMNGDSCISATAYSSLESGELPCCPPDVSVAKKADLDASDPSLVHYTIVVTNNARTSIAATLTDQLPTGLVLQEADPLPDAYTDQILQWIVPDLAAGEVETIEYSARANADGRYVNVVQMDAVAVDGTGYDTVQAAAQVDVGSTGTKALTTRYGGWQPPDWNMTTPEDGISIDLSADGDLA